MGQNEEQKNQASNEGTKIKLTFTNPSGIPCTKINKSEQIAHKRDRATKFNAIREMKYIIEQEQGDISTGKRKKGPKNMVCPKKLKTENVDSSSEHSIRQTERNDHNTEIASTGTNIEYECEDIKVCKRKRGKPKTIRSQTNIHNVLKGKERNMQMDV